MTPCATIIIPARLGSTRFPGKALASKTGKPLIQHVWERALQAACADRVVIATDDERIADAVRSFSGEAVMTSAAHPNGACRVAEAATILALPDDALVINAQGDEPELDPAIIDAAAEALLEPQSPAMATVASPFAPGEDPADPNIVKVVVSSAGDALYFSRARIPHGAQDSAAEAPAPAQPLKHVGLYAYRRWFLREYTAWPATPLERAERLEQLRVLERGASICVVICQADHAGVDTPEQYEAFVARWRAAHC